MDTLYNSRFNKTTRSRLLNNVSFICYYELRWCLNRILCKLHMQEHFISPKNHVMIIKHAIKIAFIEIYLSFRSVAFICWKEIMQ